MVESKPNRKKKNKEPVRKTVPENCSISGAAIRKYVLRVKNRSRFFVFVFVCRFQFFVRKKPNKLKRIFQLAFSCFSCSVSGSLALMLPYLAKPRRSRQCLTKFLSQN